MIDVTEVLLDVQKPSKEDIWVDASPDEIVYPARDQLNENMFQVGATKLVDGKASPCDELNWDSDAHVGWLLDLLRTDQERPQSWRVFYRVKAWVAV